MSPALLPATFALALILVPATLDGQELLRYREFLLGSSLASVAQAGAVPSEDVRLIHRRPALIQEMRWRPQPYAANAQMADPVRDVVFSFHNDRLYLIEVNYDRQRVEGLTDADLVESIGAVYGVPLLTRTDLPTALRVVEPERDTVVARWADTDSSMTLFRGTYPTSLRLVLSLTREQDLARAAASEAIRQDRQEAPQREVDLKRKATEDGLVAAEKARAVNRPAFKP